MASNDWKKKNYNSSVKVSSSTIADLKAGKTFEGNVAKFKSGATAEQREAMNRFYGKARVDTALGKSVASVNKTYSVSPGSSYKGTASNNYKAPKGQQPNTSNKSFGSGTVGTFVKNELLGVDDFKSVAKNVKSGNWGKAAMSAATGAFEAGTTAAAIVGSIFTGGATGGALLAAKTAQVAGRQAGKTVIKSAVTQAGKHAATGGAKTVASKAGLGAAKATGKVVKTLATGSVKNAPKTAAKGLQGAKKATTGARQGLSAARTEAKMGKNYVAAQKNLADASKKSSEAAKAYRSLKASGAGKPVKGLNKAYDARMAAKAPVAEARNTIRAIEKTKAKKLARGKTVRQVARRGQYAHYAAYQLNPNKGK